VGDVQGAAWESNLGDGSGAFRSFQKSAAIMDRLEAGNISNPAFRHDYVRILAALALAHNHSSDPAAARLGKKCRELADSGFRAHPDDPTAIADLLTAVSMQADLLVAQKKYEEMLPLRQRVLELNGRLAALRPGRDDAQRDLALAHKRLGALYGVLKRFGESREEYEQAAAIDEARVNGHPGDARAKMDLSFDYSDLGWVTSRQGNDAAALVAHRKALAIRVEAARADPNDFRAARFVASSTGRISVVCRRLGDLKQALATGREAVVLWTKLAERSKTDWEVGTEVGDAHADLGQVYDLMGSKPAAAAEYELARSTYVDLRDRGLLPAALKEKIEEYSTAAAAARK
jgi:tetratricopeptide (TPR) repeat protein